jgi:uncharacterized membrane protein
MVIRIALLWVLGLVTIVPTGIYYLFYYARRDEYAFLITIVLFWVFGFWGVVSPILVILKTRHVLRALEMAQSGEEFRKVLHSQDSQDVAIGLIASENHIPKFLARKIYYRVVKGFSNLEDLPNKVNEPGSSSR